MASTLSYWFTHARIKLGTVNRSPTLVYRVLCERSTRLRLGYRCRCINIQKCARSVYFKLNYIYGSVIWQYVHVHIPMHVVRRFETMQ